MARIPDAVIEGLKRGISVENHAAAELGVVFTGQGENRIGRCPLPGHNDETPSFVVTPATNLWHCFGKCNVGGSIIDLVMRSQKVGFRRAIELLKEQYPFLAASSSLAAVVPARRAPQIDLTADDQRQVQEVVTYYQSHIEEAWPYLKSRGLDSTEMIKAHRIGFSNRTLGYHLPHKQLKAGKEIRARLIEIGILRASGHEHFAGAITIPIFDEAGNITEIYGRKVTASLRKGTLLHLYLKGKHRGVWNWQGLVDTKEVILCEALIDALTIYAAGFHNVTSSYGVNGFTEDHLEAFGRYGTRRVLIAYDRDEAGELGAQDLAKKLSAAGIESARIEFPPGLDANEYATQYQPTTEQWRELIERAVPMPGAPALTISEPAAPAPVNEPEIVNEIVVERAPAQASTPTAATPAALSLTEHVDVERRGDAVIIRLGERYYRVYNLEQNSSYGQLKVNLLCAHGEQFHMDSLDMALHRDRKRFWEQAAEELTIKAEVIKRDLGKVLFKLEELQDQLIKKTVTPQAPVITMTESEREAAWQLLTAPNLLEKIISDYRHCGIVGEETNTLLGYLAAVSRLLDEPLAVIIQSSSAAGKSSLMEAVLEMMPVEQRVKYSAMTGQSLFYLGQKDLKHKILAIVEQEGAQEAAYALKLLQSEGELTIASTGKDANTGRLVTHEYRVEGPVMIFITTTAIEIDPELKNRCLVLTVNESREQTRLIHKLQREKETLAGLFAADKRKQIIALHQNAQRLLRSVNVVNPYANDLTFLDDQTRTRRDHTKYLKLIRSIALLHQYQRPMKTASADGISKQYIEVTLSDIEIANRFANEVLGRTLDELPPQTRRLSVMLHEMVRERCEQLEIAYEDYRFTQREVREYVGWSDAQVKTHLRKLVELEYVIVHRGGRGQQFVYELLYEGEGQDGKKFLMKLIDVEKLRARQSCEYDEQWEGQKREWDGLEVEREVSGMGQGGIGEGRGISTEIVMAASIHAPFREIDEEMMKTAYIGKNGHRPNHNHSDRSVEEGEN